MARNLASIQKILSINPIPDADAIEVAQINGWRVVVKKGEFQVGDLVIYLEVDSWVPTAIAPFLSKGKEPSVYNGIPGERLRTVRLRGQVSQGLILPICTDHTGTYIVAHDANNAEFTVNVTEGMDVTDYFGVVKYEPPVPACLDGLIKGAWPSRIPKTDEERIQNLTAEWDELRKLDYEVTEKLEGSSCSIYRIDGEFGVCSRNLDLKETAGNTFWDMARKYNIEDGMIKNDLDNLVIQGEVVGEGIQGNHYELKGQRFYVFAIFDVVACEYVSPDRRMQIVDALNLLHVPVIGTYPMQVLDTVLGDPDQIAVVLRYANGKSALIDKLREGLVFKQVGGQAHFKVVSNEYLIKYKRG